MHDGAAAINGAAAAATAAILALGIALVFASCGTGGEDGEGDTGTYYTVAFDLDGGTVAGAASVPAQKVPAGGKAGDPGIAEKDGKPFSGWFNGDMKWYFANETSTITADKTLKARWVPTYAVTFSNEGGSAVASQTIAEDGLAAVPGGVITKPGHTVLEGWYKEAAFTTKWGFYTDPVTSNLTLYARWLTNYTVTFNSNGGSPPPAAQTVPDGYKAIKPRGVTKPGLSLDGWYRDAAFAGSPWDFNTGTVTGNITLNANWVPPRPEEWMLVDSTFGTSAINGIAWSGSKFVAVGATGKMAHSADGVTWTAVAAGTASDPGDSKFGNSIIYGVTYGGASGQQKFVAVGLSGKMAYSADGVTWTAVAGGTTASDPGDSKFATSSINGIAWGGSTFVAVGASGKMAYSSNGETWTAVPAGTGDGQSRFGTSSNTINGIAWGNSKFVAVGASGKMAYSADGESWTAVAAGTATEPGDSKFGNSAIYGVTYGGESGQEKFVAVGAAGKMAHSTDGVTWTAVAGGTASDPGDSTFGNSVIRAVSYGGGCFLAAGASGKMAYSADGGVTWRAVSEPPFSSTSTFYAVSYGGGKFVAVSTDAAYSNDME